MQVFTDAMSYVGLSLGYTFLTVLAATFPLLVSIALLYIISYLAQAAFSYAIGWWGILATGIIGTPIHESSHLIPLLLTGTPIKEVKLFAPKRSTGELGHVLSMPRSTSLIQHIGMLVSSVAPLFGGATALWLLTWLCVPDLAVRSVDTRELPLFTLDMATRPSTYMQFILDLLAYVKGQFLPIVQSLDWRDWKTYLYLYGVMSITLHIGLSPSDIRAAIRSGALVLAGLTAWVAVGLLFGDIGQYAINLSTHPVVLATSLSYTALALSTIGTALALAVSIPIGLLFHSL
ncbi:MAG: hypothetical protein J7M34_00025 [Anaerolineae bacterium]|nr:hypothetical protein [Anaerolineae bacterium]